MLYVYDHVLMHVHALTSSLRAASAPSDTSCATVPARPHRLAVCKAERSKAPCKDTHTSTSVPCAPPHAPSSSLTPPSPPPRPDTPPSLSLCLFFRDRPRPTSLPAPLTPHTLPDPPRAVPAGPGRPRAWSPPSAPPPLPRACWRTPATGPCSRPVRVRAQVRHIVHACEGGGAGGRQQRKGKERVIRGNVYSIVVSRVYSRGEIETTGADSASVVSKLCG